jgi:hypothetical protein
MNKIAIAVHGGPGPDSDFIKKIRMATNKVWKMRLLLVIPF